jgi:Effector-associated domain 11
MKHEQQQQLAAFVQQGRLADALTGLLAQELPPGIRQEALAIQARHQRLRSQRRLGILQFSEDTITENQISASLLELIQFPADQPFPAAQSIDARIPLRAIWWKRISAAALLLGMFAALTTIAVNAGHLLGDPNDDPDLNTVTVLVHGPSGPEERILPSRGNVTLLYGDALVTQQTNEKGEATFKQIDDRFFEPDARVQVLFHDPREEPYRAMVKDSLYKLERGKAILLPVELRGLDVLRGTVADFDTGEPLDSVRVRMHGIVVYTDKWGEFVLNIPNQVQEKFQTVIATKDGYETWMQTEVPVQTAHEAFIRLKPIKKK